jgi:glycosyltransferase involved in cell wall biosynthesis
MDVLHVPFTYFPDPVGGTEIYVAELVAALCTHGLRNGIAAPGHAEEAYYHNSIPVFRFARTPAPTLANAYGAPDEDAARSFRAVLVRVRPRIVHVHARTAAVSERLVDIAREGGAKVAFTYHTPTVTCIRGTMMRLGYTQCDGKLDVRRCAACVLQSHGVPLLVRSALAATPQVLGKALERARLGGGGLTALRMPALIGAEHRHFKRFIAKVDCIVAVCRWAANVLRVNGVPESKISLCHHGLRNRSTHVAGAGRPSRTRDGALRLAYFGRLDPTKGIDLVIEALRQAPDAKVLLDIYGVRQKGSEDYAARLERAANGDKRISMRPTVPPEQVVGAMRTYDLVAVPSRCLETGPLVVLEAFAAGTPVLGARLGGIAELVTDGVDGVLIAGGEAYLWATAIHALANQPERVEKLRAGVRPPRNMDHVATEMAALYRTLLSHSNV